MSKGSKKSKRQAPLSLPPLDTNPDESWDKYLTQVLGMLRDVYVERLLPLEQRFSFGQDRNVDFEGSLKQRAPMALFLGPFSTGKSSFINYLIQNPILETGPHPVTDKFSVITYGETRQEVPGRVLVADASLPFRGLGDLGNDVVDSFSGITVPHPLLRSMTLVDTPGLLEVSGTDRKRDYDYMAVCKWFIERSDLIFILFDPTKLDSGPQLENLFKVGLTGNERKVRLVLNKADSVSAQELMRVYGSLFWGLSGLVKRTEPPRVYISSFWDKPYRENTDHRLFTEEKEDLLYELMDAIPTHFLDRRTTALLKRTEDLMGFMLVCAAYKDALPSLFGREKAKNSFFKDYDTHVKALSAKYDVRQRCFPKCEVMKEFLMSVNTDTIPDMAKIQKKQWITQLRTTAEDDLPRLLKPLKRHCASDPRGAKTNIMAARQLRRQMEMDQGTSSYVSPLLHAATGNGGFLPGVSNYAPATFQASMGPSGFQPQGQQMNLMMQQMLSTTNGRPTTTNTRAPQPLDYSGGGTLVAERSGNYNESLQQQHMMDTMMQMMNEMQANDRQIV